MKMKLPADIITIEVDKELFRIGYIVLGRNETTGKNYYYRLSWEEFETPGELEKIKTKVRKKLK